MALKAEATRERVVEIERQLLLLTAELKKLKATLPPSRPQQTTLSYPTYRKVVKEDIAQQNDENDHKTNIAGDDIKKQKPRMIYDHKSKYKVMAMEYCAKTKTPKPIESVSENEEWRFCWNYLSSKGCDRENCDWTHPKLTEEQQKNLSIRRKEVMNNRYRATLTFCDKEVFGGGDSKRNAIYAAYRQLFVSKLIDLDRVRMSKYPLAKQGTHVNEVNPKTKLYEFAQRRNMQMPSVTFCSVLDEYGEKVWKAKVIFGGKIVEMVSVRKKSAEKMCCYKLMEIFDPHNL